MSAKKFIKGDAIILYLKDSDGDYLPVACLESTSLNETRNVLEAQTKCDPGQTVRAYGTYSYEIPMEGKYIDTTSAASPSFDTAASHDALAAKIRNEEDCDWRLSTGLADTPYYYGTGLLSGLNLDAPSGDWATFSGTIMGSGVVSATEPV
jgi:hypothetical protein